MPRVVFFPLSNTEQVVCRQNVKYLPFKDLDSINTLFLKVSKLCNRLYEPVIF